MLAMRSVMPMGRCTAGRAAGGTMGLAMAWGAVVQLPAGGLTGAMSSASGSVVPG